MVDYEAEINVLKAVDTKDRMKRLLVFEYLLVYWVGIKYTSNLLITFLCQWKGKFTGEWNSSKICELLEAVGWTIYEIINLLHHNVNKKYSHFHRKTCIAAHTRSMSKKCYWDYTSKILLRFTSNVSRCFASILLLKTLYWVSVKRNKTKLKNCLHSALKSA